MKTVFLDSALKSGVAVLLATGLLCSPARSQQLIPGKNVNMLSIPKAPFKDGSLDYVDYDIFHQRQNEPSACVFANNPLTLLAGSNDYRTVDIPNPSGVGDETKDAWLSYYVSTDGGLTWPMSTLVPGFPQDTSAVGMSSPLHGFQAGSDPTIRCGVGGMAYYSGIAFNRGGTGMIFVARFVNDNNTETSNPVRYLGAASIETGNTGQFNDKPWVATDIPRTGSSGTCTVPAGPGNIPPQRTFTGGKTYVGFTTFLGTSPNNPHSRINVASSLNCGASWNTPVQVSTTNAYNLGTQIAVDPVHGYLYAAWRQIAKIDSTTGQVILPDAIIFAKSTNGGASFSANQTIAKITPFDQNTSTASFRTQSFPTMAVSVDAAGNSHIHVAWSQRGVGPGGDARIVWTTSSDWGKTWSTPAPVDNSFQTETSWRGYNSFNTLGNGHQMMPSLTFAAGKLMLIWYDFRDDNTQGVFTKVLDTNGNLTGQFTETRNPLGDPSANVFTSSIADVGLKTRHLVDVRASQNLFDGNGFCAVPGTSTCQNVSTRVSEYVIGSKSLDPTNTITQRGFNPPNFPMFLGGTAPFIGDYLEVAARMFYLDSHNNWQFNTAPSVATIFHAFWADNRDVRPPPNGDWTQYTPPGSTGGTSTYDPTQPRPMCVPPAPGNWVPTDSRNQNVYSSRLLQGLAIGAAANFKPGQSAGVFTFAVFAQNATDTPRNFRFSIPAQPSGATASFQQSASLNFVDLTIPARSTASRTLFETLTTATLLPLVTVHICEIASLGAASCDSSNLAGDVVLNDDPGNKGSGITNSEIYTPEMGSPTNANTSAGNPEIGAPEIGAPEIGAPEIGAPEIGAMTVGAPEIGAPEIGAPEIGAPEIGAPEIGASTLGDASSTFSNNGTTSGSYSVRLLNKQSYNCCLKGQTPAANGCSACQLIIHKVYTTGAHQSCDVTQVTTQNVLVNSVPGFVPSDPGTKLTDPGITDPNIPTVTLKPGESSKVTLRVVTPNNIPVTTTFLNPETGVTSAAGSLVRSIGGSQAIPKGASTISVSLALTTSTPNPGVSGPATFGNAYSFDLTTATVGGTSPFTYGPPALVTHPLPAWLNLSLAGLLSGTPTAATTYLFDVSVKDSTAPVQTDQQTMSLPVLPAPTTTAPTAVDSTNTPIAASVYGQPVSFPTTVNATVLPAFGPADGTVTLTDGPTTLQSSISIIGPSPGTTASTSPVFSTSTLNASATPHTIKATYASSSGNFAASNGTVNLLVKPADTSTTGGTSVASPVYGQPFNLSAAVVVKPPSLASPVPGTVSFTITDAHNVSTVVAAVALNNGAVQVLAPPLNAGTYTVTANYAAGVNTNFNSTGVGGSTTTPFNVTVLPADTASTIVSSANPSVWGQPVTFTATVTAVVPGAGTPTGTVTFMDGVNPLAPAVALSGGTATLSNVPSLSVATHSITAVYSGDANFNKSGVGSSTDPPISQVVNKADTTSTTLSSANPSVWGQPVTFTATVTANTPGAGTPTGQVTFMIDGVTNLGVPVTLAGGKATSNAIASLSVGPHSITARYSGDGNFNTTGADIGSTAPAFMQTVNPAPTTLSIATVSPNPAIVGQAVTVMYTLAVVSPGAGTPTGTVTILDGNGATCATPVALGGCVLSPPPAAVGTPTLTLTYSGDSNFVGSGANGGYTVDQLVFAVQPPLDTLAGLTMSPAVQVAVVKDAANTPDTSFNGSITVAIGTGPGTLSGTLTQPLKSGVAMFNDLSISQMATGDTLVATLTGTTATVTSNTFTIDANIVANGGFESAAPTKSSTTPPAALETCSGFWCDSGQGTGTVSWETSLVHSGLYAVQIDTRTAAGGRFIYQDLPTTTSTFTWTFWVFPGLPSTPPGTNMAELVASWDRSAGKSINVSSLQLNATGISFSAWDNPGPLTTPLAAGVWHQVVVQANGTTGIQTLSVDGKAVGTLTAVNSASIVAPQTVILGDTAGTAQHGLYTYDDISLQ